MSKTTRNRLLIGLVLIIGIAIYAYTNNLGGFRDNLGTVYVQLRNALEQPNTSGETILSADGTTEDKLEGSAFVLPEVHDISAESVGDGFGYVAENSSYLEDWNEQLHMTEFALNVECMVKEIGPVCSYLQTGTQGSNELSVPASVDPNQEYTIPNGYTLVWGGTRASGTYDGGKKFSFSGGVYYAVEQGKKIRILVSDGFIILIPNGTLIDGKRQETEEWCYRVTSAINNGWGRKYQVVPDSWISANASNPPKLSDICMGTYEAPIDSDHASGGSISVYTTQTTMSGQVQVAAGSASNNSSQATGNDGFNPTPVPAATPIASSDYCSLVANGANVRSGHSTNYGTLGTLSGNAVGISQTYNPDDKDTWYRIDRGGWVAKRALSAISGPCASLPVEVFQDTTPQSQTSTSSSTGCPTSGRRDLSKGCGQDLNGDGNAEEIPFGAGEEVFGAVIIISGIPYSSCYFNNAPGSGYVIAGVVGDNSSNDTPKACSY